MKNISIVWIGCHEEGILAFKTLLKTGCQVSRFITLNDESFNKRSGSSRDYLEYCKEYNIPVSLIETIKNDESYQIIKESKPDLMIVLGWSEILPERLLDIPSIGTIGAHAAMLPHGRGSAPVNWAIIKGEQQGGNSLMWLNREVDKGDIIDQIGFDITQYDTCKTVYDKVAETNQVMLLRIIDRLSNGLPTVMNKKNVTDEDLLPRRRPKDGLINWRQSNQKIYDFVRALTRPYPGAFTFVNGIKYKIWNASLIPTNIACVKEPGYIIGPVISPNESSCGYLVSCEEGCVIIQDLENEEGEVFTGKELINLNLSGVLKNE